MPVAERIPALGSLRLTGFALKVDATSQSRAEFSHHSARRGEIIYNKNLSCLEMTKVFSFPETLQEQKPAMASECAAESAKLFHTPPNTEK